MSPVVLLPDPLVVAVAWAKADPDITAIVGDRISTRLPPDPVMPYLRVQMIDGGIDSVGALGDFILQWDAFDDAGELPGASALARTLHAVALEAAYDYLPAVAASVRGNIPIAGPTPLFDEPTGWARFRVDTELVYAGV